MVKLRLRRRGRKSRPVYDIVVADSRSPRDGRYIEKIGQYNPLITSGATILDRDRAAYWLQTGAQPTDTVRDILSREGILLSIHMERKGVAAEEITAAVTAHGEHRKSREAVRAAAKAKPAVEETVEETAAAVETAPAAEAAPTEDAAPAAEIAPVEEAAPVEETTATVEDAPTEETEATAGVEETAVSTDAPADEPTSAPAAEETPAAAEATEATATESAAPDGDNAEGTPSAESDETTAA